MSAKKTILGIDEVGRGPWAGPLVVGAVILGPEPTEAQTNSDPELAFLWQNLADSKKLTAKKREKLNLLIQKYAIASATGWVSAEELDNYGLSASLKLATRRAVKQILKQKVFFSEIIIDGTINFLVNTPLSERVTLLKKADSLVEEVSAASIIAKVARDDYMTRLAETYPEYTFEKHVGYGTAVHKSALEQYGICPEHRQSFRPVKEIIENWHGKNLYPTEKRCKNYNNIQKTTVDIGQTAENIVAEFLQTKGHKIIAHNYKTKTYEIDLISAKDTKLYFTEVKYRKDEVHGSALAQITKDKQKQMHYAAEKFLSTNQEFLSQKLDQNPKHFQPLLAVSAVEGEPPTLKTWFMLS